MTARRGRQTARDPYGWGCQGPRRTRRRVSGADGDLLVAHRDGHPSSDRLGVLEVRGQGGQPRPPTRTSLSRPPNPPVISVTSVGSRDSLCNVRQTGEFVVCAPRAWAEPVNLTGTNFPARASESDAAGLTREPSVAVMPFRVAEWPSRRWRSSAASTTVDGDLGLSPGISVTGFAPGQVDGTFHAADAVALQAKSDLVAAYDDAAGRPTTATVPVEFGGTTKTPGVYASPAATFGITRTRWRRRGSGSGPCAALLALAHRCPTRGCRDHRRRALPAPERPRPTLPARPRLVRSRAPLRFDGRAMAPPAQPAGP